VVVAADARPRRRRLHVVHGLRGWRGYQHRRIVIVRLGQWRWGGRSDDGDLVERVQRLGRRRGRDGDGDERLGRCRGRDGDERLGR
jgi:hypothetical protein